MCTGTSSSGAWTATPATRTRRSSWSIRRRNPPRQATAPSAAGASTTAPCTPVPGTAATTRPTTARASWACARRARSSADPRTVPRLAIRGRLDPVQLGVLSAPVHQLLVGAELHEPRAVQDDDQVRHAHGGEAVGHEDRDAAGVALARATRRGRVAFEQGVLGLGVER